MSFDLGKMQALYSALIASVDAGEFSDLDASVVSMILDLNDFALASITEIKQKEARIADLENACRRVGTF